ncbi:hypothetical protein Golomagni_02459 [Golovinomyces magnicellulatus]|nr:hypothetical protein Golomagni_02459 [Golovinomyces magnicellulatus]
MLLANESCSPSKEYFHLNSVLCFERIKTAYFAKLKLVRGVIGKSPLHLGTYIPAGTRQACFHSFHLKFLILIQLLSFMKRTEMGRGVLDIPLKLRIRKLSSAVENTSADSAPLLERTTSSSARTV